MKQSWVCHFTVLTLSSSAQHHLPSKLKSSLMEELESREWKMDKNARTLPQLPHMTPQEQPDAAPTSAFTYMSSLSHPGPGSHGSQRLGKTNQGFWVSATESGSCLPFGLTPVSISSSEMGLNYRVLPQNQKSNHLIKL